MAAAKASQELPPKAAQLFKDLVKYHDEKEIKKGLKTAEQILRMHPTHGGLRFSLTAVLMILFLIETLAMKGLLLSNQGESKKVEAYALVKQGVAYNFNSHVCWYVVCSRCHHSMRFLSRHVYGLLYRSDCRYDDAVKCYQRALKIDPVR